MAKLFHEEDSIHTFVMRDIKESHEPIMCILKVMEVDDDQVITLLNLMTGFAEKTTKEKILKDYKTVDGENLQSIFKYVYTTHDIIESYEDKISN